MVMLMDIKAAQRVIGLYYLEIRRKVLINVSQILCKVSRAKREQLQSSKILKAM